MRSFAFATRTLFRLAAGAFYLFLDKKVTKTQGLDLLLDKPFENLASAAQVPMKDRQMCAAWVRWMFEVGGDGFQLLFLPASPRPDSREQIAWWLVRMPKRGTLKKSSEFISEPLLLNKDAESSSARRLRI